MRDITDLLPHVMPYAPNAAEPSVLKQLRDAARELCISTRLWREQDSFTVAAPDWEALVTVADAAIVGIEHARFDGGRALTPMAIADLDRDYPNWRDDDQTSVARFVTQLQPNSLTIYPRQTGLLKFGLILKPSLDALLVPDWVIDDHAAQVGKGAAGRLLVMPNTEYANPALGGTLINEWNGYCATRKTSASKGQQGARRNVVGVHF